MPELTEHEAMERDLHRANWMRRDTAQVKRVWQIAHKLLKEVQLLRAEKAKGRWQDKVRK